MKTVVWRLEGTYKNGVRDAAAALFAGGVKCGAALLVADPQVHCRLAAGENELHDVHVAAFARCPERRLTLFRVNVGVGWVIGGVGVA